MSGISREVRRCALQVLYQLDSGSAADDEVIRSTLLEGKSSAQAQDAGIELARKIWSTHEEADALVQPLSPEWPTHRQPMIDRNILRLALYEIRHAGTPGKVAINEAVDLAHEFGGEKSPGFVNAILDKIWKSDPAPESESPDQCAGERGG